MEPLERLIPLAMLGTIAAFVVFLIRRGRHERAPLVLVHEETKQTVASSPIPGARGLEVVAVVAPPIANVTPAQTPSPAIEPAPSGRTAIQTVVELLQDKDAVAVGFLLSEIFGPPVSRRR